MRIDGNGFRGAKMMINNDVARKMIGDERKLLPRGVWDRSEQVRNREGLDGEKRQFSLERGAGELGVTAVLGSNAAADPRGAVAAVADGRSVLAVVLLGLVRDSLRQPCVAACSPEPHRHLR